MVYLLLALICLNYLIVFNSVDIYTFVRRLDDSWFRCVYCGLFACWVELGCLLAVLVLYDFWLLRGFLGLGRLLLHFLCGWFVVLGDLIVGGYVCCCLVACFIMDLPGWFCKLICLVDFVVWVVYICGCLVSVCLVVELVVGSWAGLLFW